MKIPLETEPFAPVALSPAQQQQLKWLASALLDETLAENDEFVYPSNRAIDKAKWKRVMSRENVTIYKRIGAGELGGSTPNISLLEPECEPSTTHWRVPTCMGTGTMAGSLDDLLYGLLAQTRTETLLRTTYIKDELADTRVLARVVDPCEGDPLRTLLVRWQLVFQPANHVGLSLRDTVNMETVGTRVLANGQRIGYVIFHSVEVPGCAELTHLGIIRAKYSAAFVFHDTGNGSVEVYMRGFIDAGGVVGDSISVFSMCNSLISVWRLILAGQNKKLAYLVRTRDFPDSPVRLVSTSTPSRNCPLCLRSTSGFRAHATCDVCHIKCCRRCIDKRKLSHITPADALVRVSTRICKTCLTTAARMNAGDIAAREYIPSSCRIVRLDSTATSTSRSSNSQQSPDVGSWQLGSGGGPARYSTNTITSTITDARPSDVMLVASSYDDDSMSVSSVRSDMLMETRGTPAQTLTEDNLQLWIRMNQLSVEADETELLMKQNFEARAEVEDKTALYDKSEGFY